MAKMKMLGLGVAGLAAAVWSGAWYYGESRIREDVQTRILELAGQGVAVSYKSLEIGGFPFAYRGTVTQPLSQMLVNTLQGQARVDWQTSVVGFDASVSDFGRVNFSIPDTQTVKVTPLDGAPPYDVSIRSNGITGNLAKSGRDIIVGGNAKAVEIDAQSAATPPLSIEIDTFNAQGRAPDGQAGRVAAAFDLSGATINAGLWDMLDPDAHFPRDTINIKLDAVSDTSIRPDRSLKLDAFQINDIALDIAGVSIDGDGAALIQNNTPEGVLSFRVSGLTGFMTNATRAGFLPENQLAFFKAVISGIAQKGEREGEQLFKVSFKNGFTFVNSKPTFLPAPTFP